MSHDILPISSPNDLTPAERFARLVADALARLRSPRSRRVYRQTYDRWRDWCAARAVDPHALTTDGVEAFLRDGNRRQATVNRELSALRTLAAAAALRYPDYPAFETLHARLKLLRVPVDSEPQPAGADQPLPERHGKALRGDQVYAALRVWEGDRLLHRRNRALLATLFYSGLRRGEAAALTWNALDLEAGTVYVAHGKGDRARTVPLLGDTAVAALRALRAALPDAVYVFPALRRGDHPTDRPLSGEAVYRIVRQTSRLCGVDFRPHDARRTVITGIIDQGGSVRDAQAVAGHAHASTTLRYAQAADARQLRARLKLGY